MLHGTFGKYDLNRYSLDQVHPPHLLLRIGLLIPETVFLVSKTVMEANKVDVFLKNKQYISKENIRQQNHAHLTKVMPLTLSH